MQLDPPMVFIRAIVPIDPCLIHILQVSMLGAIIRNLFCLARRLLATYATTITLALVLCRPRLLQFFFCWAFHFIGESRFIVVLDIVPFRDLHRERLTE